MQQLNDTMLHLLTRHTNLALPYSDYIRSDQFPEQISELINTFVTVKYRDYYTYSNESKERAALITRDGKQVTSRPLDDTQQLRRIPVSGPDALEENDIYTGSFRVLRADKAEPYVFIGITNDCKFLITGSTKTDSETGDYYFLSHTAEYVLQINVLIGMAFEDQYVADLTRLKSTPLRVDEAEPCMSVLMEYINDTTVRFVLGDECISILQGVSDDRSKLVEYYKRVEIVQELADETENAEITKDLAEEQMGIYPDDNEFNFGDIDEGDETAVGDYDFGDLDEGVSEETVAEGDYDFDVYAITNVKIDRTDTSTDNPGEEPVDPSDVVVPITPLLNDYQIQEFRKNILEGKTIYGAL